MDESLKKSCVAAVVLAMSRVDLPRTHQIEVLESAVDQLRLLESVDIEALTALLVEVN